MSEFSLMTHHFEYDRNLGTRKLSRETPYIRLRGLNGALFMQHGKLWTEDGKPVEMAPKWALDMIGALTAESRALVGYDAGKKVDGPRA